MNRREQRERTFVQKTNKYNFIFVPCSEKLSGKIIANLRVSIYLLYNLGKFSGHGGFKILCYIC